MLASVGGAVAGLLSLSAARTAKAAIKTIFVRTNAPKDYDPHQHKWLMCLDVDKCIGCGLCVDACKTENHVPRGRLFSGLGLSVTSSRNPNPVRM